MLDVRKDAARPSINPLVFQMMQVWHRRKRMWGRMIRKLLLLWRLVVFRGFIGPYFQVLDISFSNPIPCLGEKVLDIRILNMVLWVPCLGVLVLDIIFSHRIQGALVWFLATLLLLGMIAIASNIIAAAEETVIGKNLLVLLDSKDEKQEQEQWQQLTGLHDDSKID